MLRGLLSVNPFERMTAPEACNHPWFQERPKLGYYNSEHYKAAKGKLAEALKRVEDSHEYEQRLKRKRETTARPMTNKRFL